MTTRKRSNPTAKNDDWLQLMLETIMTSVQEVKTSSEQIGKTVNDVRESMASVAQEVKTIHNEQTRLDQAIRDHEAKMTKVAADLSTVNSRLDKQERLEAELKEVREENAVQQKSIKELETWRIKRESSWTGPTVLVAALTALLPIASAIYGVVSFFHHLSVN